MSARTAVETIQAAIDRLEGLRAESTPPPWFLTYESATHPRIWGNLDEVGDAADHVATTARSRHDADIIVTLRRTIDAQLAILRFGIKRQEAVDWTHRLAGDKHRESASLELDLARAILGEES